MGYRKSFFTLNCYCTKLSSEPLHLCLSHGWKFENENYSRFHPTCWYQHKRTWRQHRKKRKTFSNRDAARSPLRLWVCIEIISSIESRFVGCGLVVGEFFYYQSAVKRFTENFNDVISLLADTFLWIYNFFAIHWFMTNQFSSVIYRVRTCSRGISFYLQ